MEKIKTVIELLDKIRIINKKNFDSCHIEKVMNDTEYGKLYHAYWQCDIRVKNIVELLRSLELKS